MKKKILLVSLNAQDVFIGQLAKRLVDRDFIVWRFYVQEGRLYHYNLDKSVALLKASENKKKSLVKMIRAALGVGKIVKNVDVVHYHYIDSTIALLSNFILPLSRKRTFATFWGSDFYKSTKKASYIRQRLLKKATVIGFTNHLTQKAFDTLHPKFSNKTITIRFGLIPMDDIKRLVSEDVLKMKQALHLPATQKIICLGTNASANQNHEQIIDTMIQSLALLRDQVHFLVPLGYPKNAQLYTEKLKAKIPEEWKSSFTFDTQFYSGKNLAAYRACIDVLIQLQTTDQFSGAMQEVLASGGDVITGAWLPYDLLKEEKVHFYQIEDFEALPGMLRLVLKHPITPEAAKHNSFVINRLSHWDEVILEWVNLYH